jgi:DNA adenine methylase
VKPLIKWPGGKSSEIKHIEKLIPKHNRYIEPFFGGGALYFDLMPKRAAINDISDNLINFYQLIKLRDKKFKSYLTQINDLWEYYKSTVEEHLGDMAKIYIRYRDNKIEDIEMEKSLIDIVNLVLDDKKYLPIEILLNYDSLKTEIKRMVIDKVKRTKQNEIKNKRILSDEDLADNLLTGFTSGLYMHFRNIYNNIQLGNTREVDYQYKIANFYFIREFCYGSMFRYNSMGEFNIPYGGISYNKKDFGRKLEQIFQEETINLFKNTDIYNLDFEDFLKEIKLSEEDFVFLDPPYDTDFSSYEGRIFDETDQKRLANILVGMKAKFILIIKNTEFIYNLYNHTNLNILTFDKNYTYNVRSRNDRSAEHLIITNIEE